MNVPRRRFLHAVGTGSVGATAALAGCSSFQESAQYLVVTNETDSKQSINVTIRRAADGTTAATTTATDATATDQTTTAGTHPNYVVDFDYELGPGGRKKGVEILPNDGTYEVLATAPDVGTGRGTYTDEESVRVTITGDGVTVESYVPE